MKKYKLDNGLPAYTENEWIDFYFTLLQNLYIANKFEKRSIESLKDGIELSRKIQKKFKIPTKFI